MYYITSYFKCIPTYIHTYYTATSIHISWKRPSKIDENRGYTFFWKAPYPNLS